MVRRFFGVKSLDPHASYRDADLVAAEVVKHLVGLVGADVEVKIAENAETLKFELLGFEES